MKNIYSIIVLISVFLVTFKTASAENYYDAMGFDPDSLLANKSLLFKRLDTTGDSGGFTCKFSAFDNFLNKEKNNATYKALAKKLSLSPNSKILECVKFNDSLNRAVILWGKNIRVFVECDDLYTCPEYTTGKGYYRGEMFVSLIDDNSDKIINTIPIVFNIDFEFQSGDDKTNANTPIPFIAPFSLLSPKFDTYNIKYDVAGGTDTTDGLATVIKFDDFTADGKKYEFALYEQLGCMTVYSTLFGYSEGKDKLINFPVELKPAGDSSDVNATNVDGADGIWRTFIVDEIFAHKCDKFGKIHVEKDYRGRGGALDIYDIKYNPITEKFEGIIKSILSEEEKE